MGEWVGVLATGEEGERWSILPRYRTNLGKPVTGGRKP